MDIVEYAHLRGYRVDTEGSVLNPKGKHINGYVGSNGYRRIGVYMCGKRKKCSVHRLVAYQKYKDLTFIAGTVVRHLDGDPLNNSCDNIALGTHSENMMDIPPEIRYKRSKHASAFVAKHNRSEIKEYHELKKSYKDTMAHFGISSKGTLHFILNN